MESITTTNTISLNCDIELTNKVLSLHAKHFTHPQENHNKYELISKRYNIYSAWHLAGKMKQSHAQTSSLSYTF